MDNRILSSSHLSLNREGRCGTTDDFATSFLHFPLFSTALWNMANSRPVHSLMLSSHLFFCLPCLLPLSLRLQDGFGEAAVACDMPEPYKVRLLKVARGGSCGPTGKLILLCTQSLVFCSKSEMRRSFLRYSVSKAWILFSESASRVHVSQP